MKIDLDKDKYEQLKRVASDPANLLENVSNFLEYNNVDLVGVQIIPSIL